MFPVRLLLLANLSLVAATTAVAGQPPQQAGAHAVESDSPDDDTIEAGEADAETPRRRLIRWNEYEGPLFTLRVGGGVLYDYAAFSQDEESTQQFQLSSDGKMRDGRVLFPRIVSASHEDFGWAAATAVAQWKFNPPMRNGQRVDVRMVVPVMFDAQKLASSD